MSASLVRFSPNYAPPVLLSHVPFLRFWQAIVAEICMAVSAIVKKLRTQCVSNISVNNAYRHEQVASVVLAADCRRCTINEISLMRDWLALSLARSLARSRCAATLAPDLTLQLFTHYLNDKRLS